MLTNEDKVTLGYAKAQTSNALMKDMVELVERLARVQNQLAAIHPVAHAWLHRGMANFDPGSVLSALDDGKGTPIPLYAARKITNSEE